MIDSLLRSKDDVVVSVFVPRHSRAGCCVFAVLRFASHFFVSWLGVLLRVKGTFSELLFESQHHVPFLPYGHTDVQSVDEIKLERCTSYHYLLETLERRSQAMRLDSL